MSSEARVLIVDDDPEIRAYLALVLDGGRRVDTCASPSEVDDDTPYDVALVDLLLADGATSERLIGRLSGRGVRVVVMTGLSPEAPSVRRARAAGAAALLFKPFTLSAVRREVLEG